MSAFTPAQEAALRSLVALWGHDHVVLVGGAALGALTAMTWRTTKDIDLLVTAEPAEATRQLAAHPGWTKDPVYEPRWMFCGEVAADIIPADPASVASGRIVWPESGAAMSTEGLELARALAAPLALSSGGTVRVAPMPAIVLLKMVSFLDRPHERVRDLADIAWSLHDYVPDADDRRFDLPFGALGIEFDQGSSYLMGAALRAIAADREALVDRFVRAVESGWLDAMALNAPMAWRRDPAELRRQLRAFRLGFDGAPHGPG